THVAVLWQAHSQLGVDFVALVAGPRFQQREWLTPVQAQAAAHGFNVTLTTADGAAVLGSLPGDASAVLKRDARQTRLSWPVLVGTALGATALDGLPHRRRLLFASLAILIFLVITGGYFVVRAVSREFAVARLQSDFVSAVSHEFRTPLTSLRQYTDLLTE